MSPDATDPGTVTLDPDLYDRIARRVEESEFDSVDEYVTFTLEELLAQLEGTADEESGDDEEVRDRLKELGYIE